MSESGLPITSLVGLVASPELLALVVLAVPIGMFFGAVPGLGGKVGIVVMIPFVFGMDPVPGAVFLLAMHAVVHTGGSVPSILFGVPGTGPDAATVVDGYPMTQSGQAGRALGASLAASGLGGVIGAVCLAAAIPVLKPVVLAFGPAEIFLLAVFGITFIAVLSGDRLVPGLMVGCLGLLASTVGMDPLTGVTRFTFGQLFLWNGLDTVTVILALFAVPEMLALAAAGGSIAEPNRTAIRYRFADVLTGLGDIVRHKWLALRTSIIGTLVGMIPGLGGDAAAWLCYGHAVQSSKTPERFGKGAVEGVIAPETANNAKEGGALMPTLFFGVPGSSGMVLMLGAFVLLGIQPGPGMLISDLGLVWTLIWALVLANLIAVAVFLVLAGPMALLVYLRGSLIVPMVLVLALLGSYLSSGDWRNLVLLFGLGLAGYALKHANWPRAPFVVGFVLGHIAEVSLYQAMTIWGPAFLLRPISLVLLFMIALSLAVYGRRRWRAVR